MLHVSYDVFKLISIHAPTRGATPLSMCFLLFAIISIHAPTRGATQIGFIDTGYFRFQSTLPRGERPASKSTVNAITDFNPRSHEGSDRFPIKLFLYLKTFQSTLPRGERRGLLTSLLPCLLYFNPRSHEGSDVL